LHLNRRQRTSPQVKSGLAPTGVLRQTPVLHNSSQFSNIRRGGVKDKPPSAKKIGGDPVFNHVLHFLYSSAQHNRST
jgi:hypothetical protein